jgi:hypothetical protein
MTWSAPFDVSNVLKKCNARTSRITRKKGAVELIDMQKAFVEWAQGAREGIARALDFDKKRLQKTALRQKLAPGEDTCRRNTG